MRVSVEIERKKAGSRSISAELLESSGMYDDCCSGGWRGFDKRKEDEKVKKVDLESGETKERKDVDERRRQRKGIRR